MINQMDYHQANQSSPSQNPSTTRPLSQAQVDQYHEEGFVIVSGFFDPEEVEPIRKACEADPEIKGSQVAVTDSHGHAYKAAIWSELGNSLLGIIPRLARMVEAAERLKGEEVYHWYSKIVKKPANDVAHIEWHQDFHGAYLDGCLFPLLSPCGISVTHTNKENGCFQVIPKSHLMGRLDHVPVGDNLGISPTRMEAILQRMEVVDCMTEPGDAIFFHPNALHCSAPNKTDQPRIFMFCHHNAASNTPFRVAGHPYRPYQKLEKLPDSVIKNGLYDSVFDTQKFESWDWYREA